MNLNWKTVRRIPLNGRVYELQRANVTGHRQFWIEYRRAVSVEKEMRSLNMPIDSHPLLTNYVSYSRPYAYRLYPSDPSVSKALPPYMLKTTRGLLTYQAPAVAALCASIIRHGATIDGSDTGIGKSYHAVSAAVNLNLKPLIVTRKSAITQWHGVCEHFKITPIDVINWETAKTGNYPAAKRGYTRDGRVGYQWRPDIPLVIFDEAHMACNYGSLNNAFWRGASAAGIPTISLSASFADRAERMRTMIVDILKIMSIEEWTGWLRDHTNFEGYHDKMQSLSDQIDLVRIHKMLYPFYGARIRSTDPAVRDFFPEEIRNIELIDIGRKNTEKQNILYARLIEKVKALKEKNKNVEAVTAELRYRQVTELMKAETLADMAVDYIRQGKAVIIFVNFSDTLKYLAKRLKTKSLIFGDQDRYGIVRDDVISDFQNDRSPVIISMVQAGGQSISLHDTIGNHPRVALIPPTYTAIDLLQVRGRIYRAKAKTPVISKLVYAANTIESKVARSVNEKLNNIKALNDGDLMEPDLFGAFDSTERVRQLSTIYNDTE